LNWLMVAAKRGAVLGHHRHVRLVRGRVADPPGEHRQRLAGGSRNDRIDDSPRQASAPATAAPKSQSEREAAVVAAIDAGYLQ